MQSQQFDQSWETLNGIYIIEARLCNSDIQAQIQFCNLLCSLEDLYITIYNFKLTKQNIKCNQQQTEQIFLL